MCGIVGGIAASKSNDLNKIIPIMNKKIIHRGPDGYGEFNDEHVALAMRRLSIIDLKGGWQPLFNEDKSIVLICNGEIYNYDELRVYLEAKGHSFTSHSDCEVILHLYEEHGLKCVEHLRGMFAFALWDSAKNRLMLARDRMGEKPLYIFERDESLIFSSEIKGLLSSGVVPFELDPISVDQYFHFAYVPEPRTPIVGVRKLPAGCLMVIDIDPWVVQEMCYWKMEDSVPLEGDPATLIREQLEDISKLIIRSDVPVGIALSAGLDSSVIAALATKYYPGTIHAFSVGYPGRPKNDERSGAKAFADYLGMPFHDVEVSVDDMVNFFPELNILRDDPIADISVYGYYAVMRLAHESGVSVMLQGQGGDELFWGYPWLKRAVNQTLIKARVQEEGLLALPKTLASNIQVPTGVRSLISAVRNNFGIRDGFNLYSEYLKMSKDQMVMFDLTPDYKHAKNDLHNIFTRQFNQKRLEVSNPQDLFKVSIPWGDVDVDITKIICQTYLLENGIAQGDRLSMASSVELRLPLVDYRLVETVIGLRKVHSDYDLRAKKWFKNAVHDLVPEWVANRRKRGFTPPVKDWYKALFNKYGDQLKDGYLVKGGIITPEAGDMLASGPVPRGAVMPISFKALVLENWCRGMNQ